MTVNRPAIRIFELNIAQAAFSKELSKMSLVSRISWETNFSNIIELDICIGTRS